MPRSGAAGLLPCGGQVRELSLVQRRAEIEALTYVAALVTAMLQLLYYATLVMGMGRRRRWAASMMAC